MSALTAYLMTAGLASDDYRFLGRAPKEAFWRRYAEYTSFERPTAVVLSKAEAFRIYLSGVLSTRRDRTKTPLRYTLVLEGKTRTADAGTALAALSAFVCDLAEVRPGGAQVESLGRALDVAFPEPFVEAALAEMRGAPRKVDAGPPSGPGSGKGAVPAPAKGGVARGAEGAAPEGAAAEGPLSEIESRVLRAIDSLPKAGPFHSTDLRFFSGGRGSLPARAQFLGFAQRLLEDGEPGAALVVNLASRDHLDALSAGEPSCAVLFSGEGGEDAHSDPVELPPKKGRPGSPKGPPRAIVQAPGAQAEPGWSIPRLGHLLWGALRTVRDWFLGTRESS